MKRIFIACCAALLLAACNDDKATNETKLASATDEQAKAKPEWIPVDSATAEKKLDGLYDAGRTP